MIIHEVEVHSYFRVTNRYKVVASDRDEAIEKINNVDPELDLWIHLSNAAEKYEISEQDMNIMEQQGLKGNELICSSASFLNERTSHRIGKHPLKGFAGYDEDGDEYFTETTTEQEI